MANPKTASEALSSAPVGTKWSNGNYSIKKTTNSSGKVVYMQQDGKTTYFPSAGDSAKYMQSHKITQANNPNYSIKPGPTSSGKKTPAATKGAPKKKTNTPKKPEEDVDKQFDSSDIFAARAMQTAFDQANFDGLVTDWRVRLALAPNANYLYAGANPGILQPLKATNGVVFPYTPTVSVSYAANYSPVDLVHTNYKVQQYTNSSVDQVTITCDFTAQDMFEARYLLAVIHFFRSMTKMFYGQDVYPIRGTPPPLCYLFGLGAYQFSAHPMAINGFTYNLPQDVDYIQTMAPVPVGPSAAAAASGGSDLDNIINNVDTSIQQNRLGTACLPGGTVPKAKFKTVDRNIATWVPTKIQLSISCLPIMSRNQVSNYFSLTDYASGNLIKGQARPGGGMW